MLSMFIQRSDDLDKQTQCLFCFFIEKVRQFTISDNITDIEARLKEESEFIKKLFIFTGGESILQHRKEVFPKLIKMSTNDSKYFNIGLSLKMLTASLCFKRVNELHLLLFSL